MSGEGGGKHGADAGEAGRAAAKSGGGAESGAPVGGAVGLADLLLGEAPVEDLGGVLGAGGWAGWR